CNIGFACGVVFAVDPKTGVESGPYAFCSQTACADGALPNARLINVKCTLYGTTYFGGTHNCPDRPPGCGTLYALDPKTGADRVLHSFGDSTDGYNPGVSLVNMKGTLYGTTMVGGSQNAGMAFGYDLSKGTERSIWSFCGSNCGLPSSLIEV